MFTHEPFCHPYLFVLSFRVPRSSEMVAGVFAFGVLYDEVLSALSMAASIAFNPSS